MCDTSSLYRGPAQPFQERNEACPRIAIKTRARRTLFLKQNNCTAPRDEFYIVESSLLEMN